VPAGVGEEVETDVPGEEKLPGFVEIDVDGMGEAPHNLISLQLPNKTIWGVVKRQECGCAEQEKIFKN
jgi:hypothetical protein